MIVVGRGTDANVDLGPLVDDAGANKVKRLVEDALAKGAKLAHGEVPSSRLVKPIVLTDVSPAMDLWREEIFGPVIAIRTASDETDALAQANDTEYGLVAYVYTRDLGRAMRVMEQLEYGMIGLNQGMVSNPSAPFGGIKYSGVGREGGYEGIEEYLETKYLAVNKS